MEKVFSRYSLARQVETFLPGLTGNIFVHFEFDRKFVESSFFLKGLPFTNTFFGLLNHMDFVNVPSGVPGEVHRKVCVSVI